MVDKQDTLAIDRSNKTTKMKNLHTLALLAAGLLLTVSSCTKDKEPTPTTPTTPTTTTPTAPTPPPMNVDNTWGGLVAIKMTLSYSQMGMSIDVPSEMAVASFFGGAYPNNTTQVSGGTVKLNDNQLDFTNNAYTKVAATGLTTSTLGIDGGVVWNVSGNGNIPAFTYTHTGAFPEFDGQVPTTINRADGFALTLNSTTVSNADSVYVFIVSGNGNVLKRYGANAGPVTIDGSDLSALSASSDTNPVYLEIIPWKYTVAEVGTSSPKLMAFVKESVIVKSITLN